MAALTTGIRSGQVIWRKNKKWEGWNKKEGMQRKGISFFLDTHQEDHGMNFANKP